MNQKPYELHRFTVYLMALFMATAAFASPGAITKTFVMDGRLMVSEAGGEIVARDLPVEPMYAFGTAAGQALFTSNKVASTPHSDLLDGEIDLWTEIDGHAYPLTSGKMVLGAAWSSALDRVVYWTSEKKVYLVDLQGTARQAILEQAASPALSPDGRELAYVRTPAEWNWDGPAEGFEIHVLDLIDGRDRVLSTGHSAHELLWTPDGRFVIYQGSADQYRAEGRNVNSLWRIDANGRDQAEQLTNVGLWSAKNPYFVKSPTRATDVQWSEDGRKMLFGATYSEAGEVMVLELDRTYRVQQALELTHGHSPFWGEDDTVLVPRLTDGGEGEKAQTAIRFDELSLDAQLAKSAIDVANAPRHFERPELGESKVSFTKAINKFRWPLHHTAGHPYTAYYDNNGSAGGSLDWKCGTFSYNGHKGTDIGVAGWWTYSGAAGNLWSWYDGCPTVGYVGSGCGDGFGNFIKLSHGYADGRNWYTIYAHFQSGSVVAQNHACSSRVGITGSSGNSSGYHLHFEVNAYGHPNDDPFSGSCSGPVSYWCNQNGGFPTTGCC